MITKIWTFIKKAFIFAVVSGSSFFVLAMSVGLSGLLDADGLIPYVALLAIIVLPIVFGILAIKKKKRVDTSPKTENHVCPVLPTEPAKTVIESSGATDVLPNTVDIPSVNPVIEKHVPSCKVNKYKVTGVTHYTDNIIALAVENPDYDMSKRELVDADLLDEKIWKYFFAPDKVELEPEPDNPYDSKAIKVNVDGQHVGYIKSGSCAHLHKVIEQGRIVQIDCTIGGGPYKYLTEEYDDEKDKSVYTLYKDHTNLFVHLVITEQS